MASLEELRQERLKKLEALKEAGLNPYPTHFSRTVTLGELTDNYSSFEKKNKPLNIVGRVRAIRAQGGLIFFNLDDGTGLFQVLLKRDEVDQELFERFSALVDMGDFVGVTGTLFVTKRGEKTLAATDWQMLAKALRPLPSEWHGLADVEERFRRRYLDSLASEEVKKRFILRSKLIAEIRTHLNKKDFLEVETPMLQTVPGGATATPFVTHHEALDLDLFLRVAPELYLKEMVVGGFPKVYELGRSFRNEGIDATHNPEFTSLEVYEAYASPEMVRKQIGELIHTVFSKLLGQPEISYNGNIITFGKSIPTMTFADLLKKYTLISDLNLSDKELILKANQFGITVETSDSRFKILDNIYKKLCRPKLIQPVFVIDYPVEFSPLAKRHEKDPNLIDRFQLIAGGLELINGFAELNDPLDQAQRFVTEAQKRSVGDAEAQIKDEAYLEAMEYGLPPTTGWGLGLDRLMMLLTDTHNIREVIFFPTLRPR